MTKHSWTISSSPSEMAKIFYPSSTLNPTKLRRLQFILFGAINDSTLLAKTFGTTNQIFTSAQLFHIEHTAAMPRHKRKKFHFNFNMLVSLFEFISDSQLRPPTAALAEIFGKCRTNFGFVGNSGEK